MLGTSKGVMLLPGWPEPPNESESAVPFIVIWKSVRRVKKEGYRKEGLNKDVGFNETEKRVDTKSPNR